MARIILITTELNGFGEYEEADRHAFDAKIDQIRREKVEEDRNERRGYDLILFVNPRDVPSEIDIMEDRYLIECEGKTYEPKAVTDQRNFSGKVEHFILKLQQA